MIESVVDWDPDGDLVKLHCVKVVVIEVEMVALSEPEYVADEVAVLDLVRDRSFFFCRDRVRVKVKESLVADQVEDTERDGVGLHCDKLWERDPDNETVSIVVV